MQNHEMDKFVTGLIAIGVTFLLWKVFSKERKPSFKNQLDKEMQKLIRACLGDKAKAIRLIEYEKQKNRSLKTIDTINMAFERLENDRKR